MHIRQDTCWALHIKKTDAYLNYTTTTFTTLPALPMTLSERSMERHSTFVFWNLMLHLELILLEFVKFIRKDDFKLCTEVLKKVAPCVFILDHYNYASWLPVQPTVYEEFVKIHCVTNRKKIFTNCTQPQQ